MAGLPPAVEAMCAKILDPQLAGDDDDEENERDRDVWRPDDETEENKTAEEEAAEKKISALTTHLEFMEEDGSFGGEQVQIVKDKIRFLKQEIQNNLYHAQRRIGDTKCSVSTKHWAKDRKNQIGLEGAKAELSRNKTLRAAGAKAREENYKENLRQFHAEYDTFEEASEAKILEWQNTINDDDVNFEANMARLNTALMKATEGEADDREEEENTEPEHMHMKLKPGSAIVSSEDIDGAAIDRQVLNDPILTQMNLDPSVLAAVAQLMKNVMGNHSRIVPTKPPTATTPKPQQPPQQARQLEPSLTQQHMDLDNQGPLATNKIHTREELLLWEQQRVELHKQMNMNADNERILAEQTATALAQSRWDQSELMRLNQNAQNQGSSSGGQQQQQQQQQVGPAEQYTRNLEQQQQQQQAKQQAGPTPPNPEKKKEVKERDGVGLALPDKEAIRAQETKTDETKRNIKFLKNTTTAIAKTAERKLKKELKEAAEEAVVVGRPRSNSFS